MDERPVGYVDLRGLSEEERKKATDALIDRFVISGNSLDQLMTSALAPSEEEAKAHPNRYDLVEVGLAKVYLRKELTDEQRALAYKILDLPNIDEGISYVAVPQLGFDFQRSAFIAIAIGEREGILESVYSSEMNKSMGGIMPYVFPKGSKNAEGLRKLAEILDGKTE